jgi:hypothetical protein
MAMQSPAVFMLLNEDDEDFAVTTAETQIGNAVEDLEGLESLAIYGLLSAASPSSGAGVTVYIQSSMAGAPWYDVACITFGDETEARGANVSSAGAVPTLLTDAAMADNTVLNGPLGDRVRAVVVTDGTFGAMSLLSLRGHAR